MSDPTETPAVDLGRLAIDLADGLDALGLLIEEHEGNELTPTLRLILSRFQDCKDRLDPTCSRPAAAAPAPADAQPTLKLTGDRIDDARSLLWEAQSLCNVGRAAYGDDGNLDAYNLLGAIERALDGAGKELSGMGVVS